MDALIQSLAHFSVPALQLSFNVLRFSSSEIYIAEAYHFELQVLTQQDLALKSFVNQIAYLNIQQQQFVGLVDQIELLKIDDSGFHYKIQLVSPLLSLKNQSTQRVFLNKTIKEIIETVLQNSPQVVFNVQDNPQHPEIVQYQEDDFHFFQRLLAMQGWIYVVKPSKPWQLLIVDDVRKLAAEKIQLLQYLPDDGFAAQQTHISHLEKTTCLLAEATQVNERNYLHPDFSLEAAQQQKSAVPAQGEVYYFGDGQQDIMQAQRYAQQRQANVDQGRQVWLAETACLDLSIASVIRVSGKQAQQFPDALRIVAMQVSVDQSEAYLARLTLIPAHCPYYLSKDHYQKPITGLQSAKVLSSSSGTADLDEQGRYQIAYRFATQLNQPQRVRAMQPLTGDDYGFHYPLQDQQEVLLAFTHGDAGRANILGVLNNPISPSPVTSENATQHVLRTSAGHEIQYQDQVGQRQVSLKTAGMQQQFFLDATSGQEKVALLNQDGTMLFHAGQEMEKRSDQNYLTEVVGEHHVQVQGDFVQLSKQGDMQFQAGANIFVKTMMQHDMHAEGGINSQAAAQILNAAYSIDVMAGAGIQLNAPAGQLSLSAAQAIEVDSLQIQVGASLLTISDGAATLSGTHITVIGE